MKFKLLLITPGKLDRGRRKTIVLPTEKRMHELKSIKIKKASERAVEAIWELINSGTYSPGDKLPPERQMSQQLGISMTSLREALQTLESYGHIKKIRGKGGGSIILDVSENSNLKAASKQLLLGPLSINDINKALRMFLIPMYLDVMAEVTDRDIRDLKAFAAKQEQDFDSHRGSILGWKFDVEVAKLSGNPIIETITEYIMLILMQKELALGIDDIGADDEAYEYNRQVTVYIKTLIDALEKKDEKLVETAFEQMEQSLEKFISREKSVQK